MEILSKEMGVPTIEIEEWKERFMEAGRAGLRARSNSREAQELRDAHELIQSLRQRVTTLEREHVLSERDHVMNQDDNQQQMGEGSNHG